MQFNSTVIQLFHAYIMHSWVHKFLDSDTFFF